MMTKIHNLIRLSRLALIIAALLAASSAIAGKSRKPANEWYMKTMLNVVSPSGDEINDNRSGVFGKIAGGKKGRDRYDVPAFSSTVDSKAAIVFVHGDGWGDEAGEYLSNYHGTKRKKDSWVFTVNSKVEEAVLTLSWDGLFELTQVGSDAASEYKAVKTIRSRSLRDLKLIDLQTLEITEAFSNGRMNSYTFTLDGETSRHFRWVLGPIKGKYFKYRKNAEGHTKKVRKPQAEANRVASKHQSKEQQAIIDRFGRPPEK